jgi:hypothetical protein
VLFEFLGVFFPLHSYGFVSECRQPFFSGFSAVCGFIQWVYSWDDLVFRDAAVSMHGVREEKLVSL